MDYIYNGELQIFQEDLDRFLDVAQRLKIDGLMTDPLDPYANPRTRIRNIETEHIKKEKSPNLKKPSYQAERPEQSYIAKVDSSINSDNISDVNEQIKENVLRNADNMWECIVCCKSFTHKKHANQHAETHLEGLSFNCPICEKSFRTRNALAIHKHKNH